MERRSRYIDYIRLWVIFLVVVVHGFVTYSGIGGWYYKEAGQLSSMELLPFLLFQSFTQSYFMGLLFLIAGYMVPVSLQEKGAKGFIQSRLVRLGAPAALYMTVIHPWMIYFLLGKSTKPLPEYLTSYYSSSQVLSGSGPLWFALALLIFSLLYAVAGRGNPDAAGVKKQPYKMIDLIVLGLAVGFCSFLVRLVQPIDSSVLNMQLCFFSQYIFFFLVGARAAKERLLDCLEVSLAWKCLGTSLVPGIGLWFGIVIGGGVLSPDGAAAFRGGVHWQSMAYALWEGVNGVLVSFGLLALFRAKLNSDNVGAQWLSSCSFGVYVLHAPILVAVSLAMKSWASGPWTKLAVVIPVTLFCSFAAAWGVKKVPVLRKIIRG